MHSTRTAGRAWRHGLANACDSVPGKPKSVIRAFYFRGVGAADVGAGPDQALSSFTAGVDALLGCDTARLDAVALAAVLQEVEVQRRRLDAVDARLLAAAQEHRLAGEFGATSLRDMLVGLLRLSPGEARARVLRAHEVGPRRALTGEPLAPFLSTAAAALQDGQISAGHVGAVLDTMRHIPPDVRDAVAQQVEQTLVQAAREMDPGRVRQVGERIIAHVDPDGARPREEEQQRLRGLTERRLPDGACRWDGLLTPECRASWTPILDVLSQPRGPEDTRSPAQRRHDALLEAAQRLLRSGTLPDCGGTPATILVYAHADDLARGRGAGQSKYGQPVPMRDVRRMAGDAEIIPVLFTDTGGILSYGRVRRFATCAQRRALAARDRGCAFPACTRPASWCESHHVTPWAEGGTTDIDGMCLLCRFHHHLIDSTSGWRLIMIDGVPRVIAPPYLDPDQIPRRNIANHPPDLDFGDEFGDSG